METENAPSTLETGGAHRCFYKSFLLKNMASPNMVENDSLRVGTCSFFSYWLSIRTATNGHKKK